MVGSSEKSGGGVSTVIKLIKKMPVWQKYSIYWLGTQLQRNALWKAWYGIKAALITPFILWRYDIIHFHTVPGTGLYTQLPQLLFAKLYRKKIIIELHVGNQLNNHTEDQFFKWWLKKGDQILLLARKWEDLFYEKYEDVKVTTDVLYNSCEMVTEVRKEEKKKLILFAGFMNDNKAPHLLLEAWKTLKEEYPDWHISLMGNGDVPRFQAMADEMGLDESVDFPGYIVGEKKEQLMRAGSIYCMCSYEEGFPMVVLESWAHNTAVVTTPVGGLPDVIEDGKNCLVFPFGDSNALAKCLEQLITNEDLRWQLGHNGCLMATEKFSLMAINKDLDIIYERMLN